VAEDISHVAGVRQHLLPYVIVYIKNKQTKPCTLLKRKCLLVPSARRAVGSMSIEECISEEVSFEAFGTARGFLLELVVHARVQVTWTKKKKINGQNNR
jgi:hypothetical protein